VEHLSCTHSLSRTPQQWIGCSLNPTLKNAARAFHSFAAATPATAWLYLELISIISRSINRPSISRRISNSISGVQWPALKLRPRIVRAAGIEMLLHPHIGEFDLEGLFSKELTYEVNSFRWLERHAGEFDAVVEIGANVGVFTVFLDQLARRTGTRLKHIYAFEPSPLAFDRLRSNVIANGCQHVAVYNCAIGELGGMLPFYEPEGHLTNGSFNRDFSGLFSNKIKERLVPAIGIADLEPLFRSHERILVKIDVEGFEPKLITAFTPMISRYRPTLIIEILETTAEAIKTAPCLIKYIAWLLDDDLTKYPCIFAHPSCRDWLLIPGS
jgi:FkbM family methyltransferase